MRWPVVLMILFLSACSPSQPQQSSFSTDDETKIIVQIMKEQEQSWNQHDLEGFMDPYWHSDSLIFIGSRGLTYGWQTTLNNYRKSYGNAELMGTLKFENDQINILQDKSAMVAGRWNLFRSADTLSGSYLLVWKKMNGEWKIIADHSS